MPRYLAIVLFCGIFFLVPSFSHAQKAKKENSFRENHTPFGKRKKERKNQKGTAGKIRRGGSFAMFKKRQKSAGNADAFASNSRGGKGFMYKLFHPNNSSPKNASLRKTKPGKVQNREQHRLFKRILTKNKGTHERIQSTNRKERARKRKRGNEAFAGNKR